MRYILDTHVLLWSMFDQGRISQTVHDILIDKDLQKYICISSIWEISIKNRIGKLPLPFKFSDIFSKAKNCDIGVFDLGPQHIEVYSTLPLLHRDPFDGIIIATALLENMTIITADENIQKYDVPCIW